jgi:hypothetical protein
MSMMTVVAMDDLANNHFHRIRRIAVDGGGRCQG